MSQIVPPDSLDAAFLTAFHHLFAKEMLGRLKQSRLLARFIAFADILGSYDEGERRVFYLKADDCNDRYQSNIRKNPHALK